MLDDKFNPAVTADLIISSDPRLSSDESAKNSVHSFAARAAIIAHNSCHNSRNSCHPSTALATATQEVNIDLEKSIESLSVSVFRVENNVQLTLRNLISLLKILQSTVNLSPHLLLHCDIPSKQ